MSRIPCKFVGGKMDGKVLYNVNGPSFVAWDFVSGPTEVYTARLSPGGIEYHFSASLTEERTRADSATQVTKDQNDVQLPQTD